MAKKKQFAGKKTKLAKLPLTQALANHLEGGASSVLPSTPPSSFLKKAPIMWDEVLAGHRDPLAATFLFLVRELADLTSRLQSDPDLAVMANHRLYLPPQVPRPAPLAQALREARDSLRHLQSLLSHP
jgi:hypothetical protein